MNTFEHLDMNVRQTPSGSHIIALSLDAIASACIDGDGRVELQINASVADILGNLSSIAPLALICEGFNEKVWSALAHSSLKDLFDPSLIAGDLETLVATGLREDEELAEYRILYVAPTPFPEKPGNVEHTYVPDVSLLYGALADQEIIVGVIRYPAGLAPGILEMLKGSSIAPVFMGDTSGLFHLAYLCDGSREQLQNQGLDVTELCDSKVAASHCLYLHRVDGDEGVLKRFEIFNDRKSRVLALPCDMNIQERNSIVRFHQLVQLLPSERHWQPAKTGSHQQRNGSGTAVLQQILDGDRDVIKEFISERAIEGATLAFSAPTRRFAIGGANSEALKLAQAKFRQMGLTSYLTPFTYLDSTFENLSADLNPDAKGGTILVAAHIGANEQRDTASIASVLAVASLCQAVNDRTPLWRAVRFVLFNGHDSGLVSSQHFARQNKNIDRIRSLIYLDIHSAEEDMVADEFWFRYFSGQDCMIHTGSEKQDGSAIQDLAAQAAAVIAAARKPDCRKQTNHMEHNNAKES